MQRAKPKIKKKIPCMSETSLQQVRVGLIKKTNFLDINTKQQNRQIF